MSDGKNWFETGYEGAEREAEKKDLGYGPSTFWLIPQASRELVFVDDIPFCFNKHQWRGQSKRPEFATCISVQGKECAPCSKSNKAEFTGHLTVVDCTGYTDSKGKVHKFELVEFCPKQKVMNKLKVKKEKKGTFAGMMWNVTRGDEHSPNTGDDFDFVREVKMEELYKLVSYKGKKIKDMIDSANGNGPDAARTRKYLCHHFQVPETGPIPERIPVFNYKSLHEPLDPAVLAQAFASAQNYQGGGFKNSGGSDGGGGAKADEEIPF